MPRKTSMCLVRLVVFQSFMFTGLMVSKVLGEVPKIEMAVEAVRAVEASACGRPASAAGAEHQVECGSVNDDVG